MILELAYVIFLVKSIELVGIEGILSIIDITLMVITPVIVYSEELNLEYLLPETNETIKLYDSTITTSDLKRNFLLKPSYLEFQRGIWRTGRSKLQKMKIHSKLYDSVHTETIQVQSTEISGWCNICNLPIFMSEKVFRCPFCQAASHWLHLLEWVRIKGFCPTCNSILRNIDFEGKDPEVLIVDELIRRAS